MTATPAVAGSGGASASASGGGVGGAEYGAAVARAVPPRATTFRVAPRALTVGQRPRIVVRVDAGGDDVRARVVFTPVRGTGGQTLRLSLGRVAVGRTVEVPWPAGRTLAVGRYVVRLHASDSAGQALERGRRTPGRTTLTVRPPSTPTPTPTPTPDAPPPAPAVPAPAPTRGGIFPVAGPYTYGDGFDVGRAGYRHQGVDLPAAEGTPVVSPTAGTIRFTDFQASRAGEYLVERLADGRDVFLAHCARGSTAVSPGQTVVAGQRLCLVGATGNASGPLLHVELWPQGWRDVSGTAPVDPLAQLHAWE